MRSLSRREFLVRSGRVALISSSAYATASLLSGCGSGSSSTALPDDVQIVQRFPQNLVAGPVRLPLSLASAGGLLTVDGATETPESLSGRVVRIDGDSEAIVVDGLIARRHDAGITTPYWPFTCELADPGFYRIVLDGGPRDGAAFQVFARGEIAVPGIGDALPAFDTPTLDEARGVDPICTKQPEPCPLHQMTLREALTLGKPIVFLVGTPAHCSTGTCSPALDGLVAVASRDDGSRTYLHAEVYADPDATTVAPIVKALSMNYEPALFFADAGGIVTARLDAVFDEVELASLLG